MVVTRTVIGVALAFGLFGLLWLDSQCGAAAPVVLLLGVVIAVRSVFELHALYQAGGFRVAPWPLVAAGCAATVASCWLPVWFAPSHLGHIDGLAWPASTLTCAVLALCAYHVSTFQAARGNLVSLAFTMLSLVYVGWLLSLVAQLRWIAGPNTGFIGMGALLAATKAGDSSAYFAGKLFGRSKMAPLLSPHKTWAGFFGALVGSAAATAAWMYWIVPLLSGGKFQGDPLWGAVAGLLMGLAGVLGDLLESLIKRDVNQKDSAPFIPGFGGILDLVDSVLLAAPAGVFIWKCLPLIHAVSNNTEVLHF